MSSAQTSVVAVEQQEAEKQTLWGRTIEYWGNGGTFVFVRSNRKEVIVWVRKKHHILPDEFNIIIACLYRLNGLSFPTHSISVHMRTMCVTMIS
jgi:hypothetical protein